MSNSLSGTHARTHALTDNMQFFVWHGSQNLCQTMRPVCIPAYPRYPNREFTNTMQHKEGKIVVLKFSNLQIFKEGFQSCTIVCPWSKFLDSFLVQPLPGWTPIIGPEIYENRLFWLSMIHMILISHRGILDLLAGLSTVFTLFGRLFSNVSEEFSV